MALADHRETAAGTPRSPRRRHVSRAEESPPPVSSARADSAMTVDARDAQAALAATVVRLTTLIRSTRRPTAHAVGEWTVRDVAVHLAHAWEVLPSLAAAERDLPLQDVGDLSALTQTLVRDEGDVEMTVVADRIDAAATAFFAQLAARPMDATGPWLVAGMRASLSTFTCHLLNESLVHGYDIARAEGVPWPIESSHAGIVLVGFLFTQLAKLDPRAMVVQEKAAGLRARYDIRIRGTGRVGLAFDDGAVTVEHEPGGKIDYHVSADATALFLVMWGRTSQWHAILRGQLLGWGRRPWLGVRLRSLLRNP